VHLPACVVAEELRDFVAAHGRAPHQDEQLGILTQQAAREDAAAESCTLPWLVGDPAPVMTAAYSIDYFDDHSLLAAGIRHARGYELMAWCGVDIPWLPDPGQRDGVERRSSTHGVLTTIVVPALRAAGITVVEVDGPVHRRSAEVMAWLPEAPEAAT